MLSTSDLDRLKENIYNNCDPTDYAQFCEMLQNYKGFITHISLENKMSRDIGSLSGLGPLFLMVASDKLSADLVFAWAYDAENAGYPAFCVASARQCAKAMKEWSPTK